MATKRENVVKVRYSDDELKQLKDSVRMPVARYIREISLEKVIVRHTSLPTVDNKLMQQHIRVGNNLNQTTKAVNEQQAYFGSIDMVLLSSELAMIRYQLDMILEAHKIGSSNLNDSDFIDLLSDNLLDELEKEVAEITKEQG